jgi:hypothetical protein
MDSETREEQRVQFDAPETIVQQVDTLSTVRGTDRTSVIPSALQEYLRNANHKGGFKQEFPEAYYDGDIMFSELEAIVGHEDARKFRVLKEQLDEESIDATGNELTDS